MERYKNVPVLQINMIFYDDDVIFRVCDIKSENTYDTDEIEDALDIVYSNLSYYSFKEV